MGRATTSTSTHRGSHHLPWSGRVLAVETGYRAKHADHRHPSRPGAGGRNGGARWQVHFGGGAARGHPLRDLLDRDTNTLRRITPPTPNPLALNAAAIARRVW